MPFRTPRLDARVVLIFLASISLTGLSPDSARRPSLPLATATPQACESAQRIASDLWQEYERETKEAGCYVDWVPSSRERFRQCLVEYSKAPFQIAEEMIGFWNSMAENEWATLGPRRIEPGGNDGTLVAPGNRMWLGATPAFMDELSLRIAKRSGRSETEITVCSTGPDGSTRTLLQTTVGPGATGLVVDERFDDPEPGILSVVLRSRAAAARRFQYTLEVEHDPTRFDAGPVDGFADLHLHQMADEAYAGLWYWGDHADMNGPRACVALESADPVLERAVSEAVGVAGAQGLELGEDATSFYTHAIPNVFPSDGDMTIAHGEPAPASLDGWPRYDDIAHQQANARWLKDAHDAGLQLVVVSAVNFQAACKGMRLLLPEQSTGRECGDMENVRRQLEAAQEMDRRYDWYEIAVHPWHARKIIAEGKLAVVLSLEASNVFPRFEGDFVAQLEDLRRMGLRTMQLAHETNSRFAGAAPHRPLFSVFEDLKHPLRGEAGFELDARGKNELGLTDEGRRLVDVLMGHHMLIDVAHLSERSVRDLYEVAEGNDYYPLYDSHTRLEGILTEETKEEQREFLTTCEQARFIERTGGMVGLRTGDTELLTHLGEHGPVVSNTCPGSARSFAQLVQFAADRTGLDLAFGSDLNGFITQVGPRFGPEACHRAESELERTAYAQQQLGAELLPASYRRVGLSHVGYLPDLLADLDAVGTDVTDLESSAEAFLRMWERAWAENRGMVGPVTSCPGWTGARTARAPEASLPEPQMEVDDLLEVRVRDVRGIEGTVDDFGAGEAVAGAFQRNASFVSASAGGGAEVSAMRLREAAVDEDGFLVASDVIGPYEPGTELTTPGRYALEVVLMGPEDRTLVGHTLFRVLPNPDSVRAEVTYDLRGELDVVEYRWDGERGQYAYTHSRGSTGHSTDQAWTFRGHMVPEVRTWEEVTVQDFGLLVDGEPVESGDTISEPGEHTIEIYACHNALADPCGETSVPDGAQAADDEPEPPQKKQPAKKKTEAEADEAAPSGPLPSGMMLIARHDFTVAEGEAVVEAEAIADAVAERRFDPVLQRESPRPAIVAARENAAADLSGVWDSTYGELRLHQVGRYVVGDYAEAGVILGTITGSCVAGVFTNGVRSGVFRFELEEGSHLDGAWAWHGSTPETAWDGERTASEPPAPLRNFAAADVAVGRHPAPEAAAGTYDDGRAEMRVMVRDRFLVGEYGEEGAVAGVWDGDSFVGRLVDDRGRTDWFDVRLPEGEGSRGQVGEEAGRSWSLERIGAGTPDLAGALADASCGGG